MPQDAVPCGIGKNIIWPFVDFRKYRRPSKPRAENFRLVWPIMASEKAEALVLRTTDWSESSRIATLWTRELGKVRVVAKGGRRLRSSFDNALDLLTFCSIVLLRKSTGNLDLLTEARVVRRFPRLRENLEALYAAYYVAELLADWTQENDPHPVLFDEVVQTLEDIGSGSGPAQAIGPRVLRFEAVFLHELGYRPILDRCANCARPLEGLDFAFSPQAGGLVCRGCRVNRKELKHLSLEAVEAMRVFAEPGDAWRRPWEAGVKAEVRQLMGHYLTYLRGRRPRLLPYLGG
jgi:DNA repair protein RecO (recombination protein O)